MSQLMLTSQQIRQFESEQNKIDALRQRVYKVAFTANEKRLAYKALSGEVMDPVEVDRFFALAEVVSPVKPTEKKAIKAVLGSPFIYRYFDKKQGAFV